MWHETFYWVAGVSTLLHYAKTPGLIIPKGLRSKPPSRLKEKGWDSLAALKIQAGRGCKHHIWLITFVYAMWVHKDYQYIYIQFNSASNVTYDMQLNTWKKHEYTVVICVCDTCWRTCLRRNRAIRMLRFPSWNSIELKLCVEPAFIQSDLFCCVGIPCLACQPSIAPSLKNCGTKDSWGMIVWSKWVEDVEACLYLNNKPSFAYRGGSNMFS